MKKKIRIGFLLAPLMLSASLAEATLASVTAKIVRIDIGASGEGFAITIDQNVTTTCSVKSSLLMQTSVILFRENYSLALAAQAQGKPLTLSFDNSACQNGTFPLILSLSLSS